jgi:hypothetical protein
MKSSSRPEDRDQQLPESHQDTDPLAALEHLRYDLGRVESFASAAREGLERLPRASTADGCDTLRRLDHLVTFVADEILTVYTRTGETVHRLTQRTRSKVA